MEEQRCEYCVWYDPDDNPEWEMTITWCNKWEAPVGSTNYCGWYVPKDS